MQDSKPSSVSRRTFIAGAAAAGAARSVLTAKSSARIVGANDRLHVGVIGAGGNANGHMRALKRLAGPDNVEITAVCDIYDPRREAAAEFTGGDPYRDYRRVLERPELDYVTISVPEHWHARMTLDAADEGLHVYVEKPLTYSIDEGLAVVKKVRETGITLQCGIQGMSDDSYETAAGLIKDGAIGPVVMAHIDYSRNHREEFWLREPDPDARPGVNLDWNAYLGKARKRPWDPDRFFSWRRYWDYSGGIATDLFVHRLARIVRACGLSAPSRVVATGGNYFFRDGAEVPDTFNALLEYPEGMNVLLVSTMANQTKIRHVIRGKKGTIEFSRGRLPHRARIHPRGRGPAPHPQEGRPGGHGPAPPQPAQRDPRRRTAEVRRAVRIQRLHGVPNGSRVVPPQEVPGLGRPQTAGRQDLSGSSIPACRRTGAGQARVQRTTASGRRDTPGCRSIPKPGALVARIAPWLIGGRSVARSWYQP